jgi:RimJ/RimL family protein N-acetyltransferase
MRSTPFLRGDRIFLRPLEEADCDGPYPGWFSDPEVCRFNSHHLFPYSREEALDYVRGSQRSRTELVLAIVEVASGKHIGNIALQAIDYINRNAEFAILLGDRTSWGKGYSKEAGLLLLKHGFDEINLHRIYCGTHVENIPMQRLAAALYMQREGVRRDALFKNGEYAAVIEFGVLAGEFRESRSAGETTPVEE